MCSIIFSGISANVFRYILSHICKCVPLYSLAYLLMCSIIFSGISADVFRVFTSNILMLSILLVDVLFLPISINTNEVQLNRCSLQKTAEKKCYISFHSDGTD